MGEQVRGYKHIPAKVIGIVAAGRSTDQQIEDVGKEGMYFTPSVLRNSIIGGLEIPRRETAENLIVMGCACYGTAMPLRGYFQLLDRLDIDYTFLTKEYCCGFPIVQTALLAGEGRGKPDGAAREFVGLNIEQARKVGAKRMAYFCTWCLYTAKRFYSEIDIPQLFYPDILIPRLDKESLRLKPTRVGYFGGRPHRYPVIVPENNVEVDWSVYRRLLERIEGLEVVDIPRYCCTSADWAIWERLAKEGLNTLVTTCIVCYGRLWRRAPKGIKVKFLSDILLQALGS